MYLLVSEYRQDDQLFNGGIFCIQGCYRVLTLRSGSQEDRFAVQMKSALNTAEGKTLLASFGLNPDDIGVHSIRKGSSSWALSGSTASPSQNSVRRRAGWKYSTSEERYLQEEPGGDQYCGRVVAGLDLNSPKFAVLPPHFAPNAIEQQDLQKIFPAFGGHAGFLGVLSLALASMVYHDKFLRESFPRGHQFFSSTLHSDPNLLPDLSALVHHGLSSPHMKPTGVPPHVTILLMLEGIDVSLSDLPPKLTQQIEEVLQRNGAAAANITPAGLARSLEDILTRILPHHLIDPGNAPPNPAPPVASYQLYTWGGSFHRLPEGYKFPGASLAGAFRLWFNGATEGNIPPFKSLEPTDFSDKNQRKRLSDWRYLMGALVEALDGDYIIDNHNQHQVDTLNSQFKLAMERVPMNPRKRKTRPEEWTVVTAVREIRTWKKRRIGDGDNGSDDAESANEVSGDAEAADDNINSDNDDGAGDGEALNEVSGEVEGSSEDDMHT
jgi:hypothetical protein